MKLFRFIILNINVCSRTKVASVCLSPFFLDVAVCENWSRTGLFVQACVQLENKANLYLCVQVQNIRSECMRIIEKKRPVFTAISNFYLAACI